MVKVSRGTIVTTDPAIKVFIIHLEEKGILTPFILEDLDASKILIQSGKLAAVQEKIDEMLKENTFPVVTDDISGV